MKIIFLILCLLITGFATNAQDPDTALIVQRNDSLLVKPIYNMYGDLLNDDPAYNKKARWYVVSAGVLSTNIFNWAVARYIYRFDWTSSGIKDWKNSFKQGPEWDSDGFGINFLGHPHSGAFYFNTARSDGYSFWQCFPFALQGSLTWEFLGENTRPSYNDLINTPVSGMFLGEIFYRISSNILDDRTSGKERILRELLAGIIDPPRGFNRLISGKIRRRTTKEIYQKEPLNITFNAGAHRINEENVFGSGGTNVIANLQIDYGNPFERRKRKPFDVFSFRIEGSYGNSRKLLENINGYGILAGRTNSKERSLLGIFQHFDYWNNNVFEVGSLGYGGGLIARTAVAKHSNIYSTIHLAVVPLAGNNTRYGPDTSSLRHYNFGGGFQGKIEETFNLNRWASIGFTGFYYWIHTYSGIKGNSMVGIFKPSLTLKVYKNLSVGFEHLIYQNDRYINGEENFHLTRTEQKLFLQLFFESKKKSGLYH